MTFLLLLLRHPFLTIYTTEHPQMKVEVQQKCFQYHMIWIPQHQQIKVEIHPKISSYLGKELNFNLTREYLCAT